MREIDEMREREKARASSVFGAIHLTIVAVIMLAGLWQAVQLGLLHPDWWQTLMTEYHWK